MTRNVFSECCSAWSAAPWLPGARHAIVTIGAFAKAVTSGKYADRIGLGREYLSLAWEAHRQAEAATSPQVCADAIARRDNLLECYKRSKGGTPVALLQGVNERHDDAHFTSLANVLAIDIDAPKPGEDDNGNAWVSDWHAVKRRLAALPWVAFASLSFGGQGVFALVPIECDDKVSYGGYYAAWSQLLAKAYNLHTDPSCTNRGRLRFMSADPDAISNEEAEVWVIKADAEGDSHRRDERRHDEYNRRVRAATTSTLTAWQRAKVFEIARYCISHGISLADTYDDWMKLAAFFAHHLGDEEGRRLFVDLSMQSAKFRPRDAYKMDDFKAHPHPATFETYCRLARAAYVPNVPKPGDSNKPHIAPWGSAARRADEPGIPPATRPTPAPTDAPPAQVPTPVAQADPPMKPQEPRPVMSASEALLLRQHADFVAEGQAMVTEMREANSDFDALCDALGLKYVGHRNAEGQEWYLSRAQFEAVNAPGYQIIS